MFLPRISLTPWILAVLLAACGARSGSIEAEAGPPSPAPARIAAGTGDVDPALLDRTRAAVGQSLAALREVFEGLEVAPFFVHVHERRDTMPPALVSGLHDDSPGFALLGRHQVHLIWGEMIRTGALPEAVVRHELVHELLDQYVQPNGAHLPRWFHEGLAQRLAGDTYLGAREEDLVWRVGTGSMMSFGSLAERFPADQSRVRSAYAQSYSYVAWLERRYGLPLLLRVARNTDRVTSFGRALVAATGRTTLQLEDGWRDYLLHGSGASWRVLLENWFALLMIAVLPVLVLALMRRLNREQHAARRLAMRARPGGVLHGPPAPQWFLGEGDDGARSG